MCGICGEIRFDNTIASIADVSAMNSSMVTRGPDSAGLFSQGAMAFGHRRLKIIDLSEKSQQPMFDATLGLGIVFNGAIYNFREIKKKLTELGYSFFSAGDTEVILKAYHAWGEDFVNHLNGMFAFAIWERNTGRVVLGRDRLGIKPIYYSLNSKRLLFASTLPALLKTDDIDKAINPVALHHYMSFHAVVPAPHTILKGISKLPPATLLIVEPDGTYDFKKYWEPRFERQPGDNKLSFEEWQELVLAALRKAVRRRLVADVPVGVLLSGGLDSSLIVGLLAEEGQKGLNTYSIGFEDVGKECGNEFQYSDIIAEHFQTDHHKIFIDCEKLLPSLAESVQAMSEPMVSHDAVGFYLLSSEVAKSLKVVQSGQGADEVFAGYYWYPPMMTSKDPVDDYAEAFFDRDHSEYTSAINSNLVKNDFSFPETHHF